jgi:hypothetical protein
MREGSVSRSEEGDEEKRRVVERDGIQVRLHYYCYLLMLRVASCCAW